MMVKCGGNLSPIPYCISGTKFTDAILNRFFASRVKRVYPLVQVNSPNAPEGQNRGPDAKYISRPTPDGSGTSASPTYAVPPTPSTPRLQNSCSRPRNPRA